MTAGSALVRGRRTLYPTVQSVCRKSIGTIGTLFRCGACHDTQLMRLSYNEPCGSSTRRPHLVWGHLAMSCRIRYSSIFDLPVPVEPQMYKCVDRISGVISSGTPLPSAKPSFTLL